MSAPRGGGLQQLDSRHDDSRLAITLQTACAGVSGANRRRLTAKAQRRCPPKAVRLLGVNNENVRRLKAEDLVDDSLVRKLEKEGRF